MPTVTLKEYLSYCPQRIEKNAWCPAKKSAIPAHPREDELEVRPWSNFESEAQIYARDLIREHNDPAFNDPNGLQTDPYGYSSEGDVALALHEVVGSGIFRDLKSVLKATWAFKNPQGYVTLQPDYVLVKAVTAGNGKTLSARAVVEVKKPHLLPELENGDLVAAIAPLLTPPSRSHAMPLRSSSNAQLRKPSYSSQSSALLAAVYQLCGYMTVNHLRYGVLTTFNSTFFIRRIRDQHTQASILEVSPCISVQPTNKDDLHIFSAWLYFAHLADGNYRYSSPYSTPILSPTNDLIELFKQPSYEPAAIFLSDLKFMEPSEFELPTTLKALLPTSETVFVKALDLVNDDGATERFWAEVRAYRQLEKLQHCDVIPKFRGCFSTEGISYWIMLELCSRRINQDEVCRHAQEISAAFEAIHSLGVCHGDVHLRNIMIGTNGHVRIVDFGLARFKPSSDNSEAMAEWTAMLETEKNEIRSLLV